MTDSFATRTSIKTTKQPDMAGSRDAPKRCPGRTKPRPTQSAIPTKRLAGKRSNSKTDLVLKKLRSSKGATIETLCKETAWQAHSVRGFLSGTIRKKLGLDLVSENGKDGRRRYRIVSGTGLSKEFERKASGTSK